jgi:hypothetical protein
MNTFKKLLPSLLPLAGAVLTAFTPQLQHAIGSFVSVHPAVASFIVSLGGFIYHLLPSPASK